MTSEAKRLDVRVAEDNGLSRTAAQALITGNHVEVNGKIGKAGDRVTAHDVIHVEIPPTPVPAVVPGPPVELRVVYEDESLAVIDKPAGMVVHPAPGHAHGTLADGLQQRGSGWSLVGGAERAGIVHRLDRYTSGLLVVAKTDTAHRALAAQLADRTMKRTYWALVRGSFNEESGLIDAPIGRNPRYRQRMAVVDSGKTAQTSFVVLERHPQSTVLSLSLTTGRTHQIRVHCASIHHPVVGDPVYGKPHPLLPHRPALHAAELTFIHPVTGEQRQFSSPLPADLVTIGEVSRQGQLR